MFKCPLTKVAINKTCQLNTCMWSSVNKLGCMAYPKIPEAEDLTDVFVAKNKGLTIEEVLKIKEAGNNRIAAVLTLHNLFDWLATQPLNKWPNCDIIIKTDVQKAVNRISKNQWPYTVMELHWTPIKIAVTVNKIMLLRFSTYVGKKIEWTPLLNIDPQCEMQLIQILNNSIKEIK